MEALKMDIISSLASTVIFLFADGGQGPIGTGFLVGYPVPGQTGRFVPLIVTAKHVIGDRRKVVAQYSTIEGKTTLSVEYDLVEMRAGGDLWEHPDKGVDLIVFRTLHFDVASYQVIPFDLIASKETFDTENVKATDRVFFPSLLVNFMGLSRNYPAIRDGAIAVLPEEKVPMKYEIGSKLIETNQEIMLINATSVPGASGSPVFLYPGSRIKNNSITLGGRPYLIGVMQGFYPASPREVHEVELNAVKRFFPENSDIAIIFPAWRLHEVLSLPSLVKRMEELLSTGATPLAK